ncbi:MAG: hypothetical protein H0W78_16050 [Planctomycetes bacterium]|nr:hypothetical protein [Planctomycetota bacterium]
MMPDVKKEEQTGWLVLAGSAVVILIVLWLISDGGELAEAAEQANAALSVGGREDMAVHVERQVEANGELRKTIEALKSQTDFVLADEFAIAATERQPGYFFKRKFVEVRERLRDKAERSKIAYDQNIGFGADPAVPPDEQAPYLLTMLQLTEKIVGIAFDSERPLESLSVSHGPAIDTGPETRPALVREYPLKLEVRGGLKDILGILHRISQSHPPGKDGKRSDFPLILRGFSITSENATPKDDIQQLAAVFDLAAMRFISEEERAQDPLAFQPVGGGTRGSSSGRPVFHARP